MQTSEVEARRKGLPGPSPNQSSSLDFMVDKRDEDLAMSCEVDWQSDGQVMAGGSLLSKSPPVEKGQPALAFKLSKLSKGTVDSHGTDRMQLPRVRLPVSTLPSGQVSRFQHPASDIWSAVAFV